MENASFFFVVFIFYFFFRIRKNEEIHDHKDEGNGSIDCSRQLVLSARCLTNIHVDIWTNVRTSLSLVVIKRFNIIDYFRTHARKDTHTTYV